MVQNKTQQNKFSFECVKAAWNTCTKFSYSLVLTEYYFVLLANINDRYLGTGATLKLGFEKVQFL